MFIETETTDDPNVMRFYPGREVAPGREIVYGKAAEAEASPLAGRLFEVDGIEGVHLTGEAVAVVKSSEADWTIMKPQILGAIMQHFMSGEPVLREAAGGADGGDGAADAEEGAEPVSDADPELIEQVKELIDTRIHPAVSQSGGDIALHSMMRDGTVNLRLEGTAFSLLSQIGNMLQHYVPEVTRVQDYRDAVAKPGLETETGRAVREILETRVNPAVHGHGGHISLIDVRGETVYIRLEGGCQGCGMADVTLKQGVEREIKRAVPAVEKILDVTDHASGSNPYYQPGKGGASPVA